MMKIWKFAVSLLCLMISSATLADTTAADQKQNEPQWIFLLKSTNAQIKETKPNHFQLIVGNLADTKIYMLNDRPFYLIRTIDNQNGSIWGNFAHSNYKPNQKVAATLILGNEVKEIMLSHFQLHGNYVTYDVASNSKTDVLQPSYGPMELFLSMDSRPLCNLMNQLHHDALSTHKLNEALFRSE